MNQTVSAVATPLTPPPATHEPKAPLTFPGRNSRQRMNAPDLPRVISQIVGEPVRVSAKPGAFATAFRITLAGEPSRFMVHVDPPDLYWVGVCYLNLPEQCQGGTCFFRHKASNSDSRPWDPQDFRKLGVDTVMDLLQRDGNDPDCWEQTMTVPMRYNRLILYRPWLWHSSDAAFGDSLENGRLIQVFAFESAKAPIQQPRPGAPAAGPLAGNPMAGSPIMPRKPRRP